MTDATEYDPDYAVPPGETIAELMDQRGITTAELGSYLGIGEPSVVELLSGKLVIDDALAKRLAITFHLPVAFWLKREANYRERLAREANA